MWTVLPPGSRRRACSTQPRFLVVSLCSIVTILLLVVSWCPWSGHVTVIGPLEGPPSSIGVMSTTLSTEVGPDSAAGWCSVAWMPSSFDAYAASERKSSLASHLVEFIVVLHWEHIVYDTALRYWVVHCLGLSRNPFPVSSRCSRFPDVGRHQRDRGSHWYENTWLSCLCMKALQGMDLIPSKRPFFVQLVEDLRRLLSQVGKKAPPQQLLALVSQATMQVVSFSAQTMWFCTSGTSCPDEVARRPVLASRARLAGTWEFQRMGSFMTRVSSRTTAWRHT